MIGTRSQLKIILNAKNMLIFKNKKSYDAKTIIIILFSIISRTEKDEIKGNAKSCIVGKNSINMEITLKKRCLKENKYMKLPI
jgi:hypothetical protein